MWRDRDRERERSWGESEAAVFGDFLAWVG